MKKSLNWVMVLALLLAAGRVGAQKEHKPLETTALTKDIYVYTTYGKLDDGSSYPSNSLYIVTQKGIVMLDVPWDTTQTLPLLKQIEQRYHKKVIACISTHFHDDRTAGLDMLKARGIKTYSIAQTQALCRKENNEVPEYTIPGDTVFNFGNYRLRAFYPGAGHAPDNIVVWIPEAKILYGGCFVKSMDAKDLGNLDDADPVAWPASMRKVQQAFPAPRVIVPGHGDIDYKQKTLVHTLELLEAHKKKS